MMVVDYVVSFFYGGESSTLVWKSVLVFAGTPWTWMGMDRLQRRNLWRKVFNQFIIPLFHKKIYIFNHSAVNI